MAEDLLVLQKIRIRGLGSVIDSAWFEIGNDLTVFSLPESFDRQGFCEALQTINPPYDIEEQEPFKNYPNITRQGKYQKRVRPDRRTIALTIFAAQPAIVKKLAAFSLHLYETDRIEVGRRLDYSRWINFVEIASSTRWSEIETDIKRLLARIDMDRSAALIKKIQSLKKTDRIKDEIKALLESIVEECAAKKTDSESEEHLDKLLNDIRRQSHFNLAKKKVEQLLPLFHCFNGKMLEERGGCGFIHLRRVVLELLENERGWNRTRPIVIFDEPSFDFDQAEVEDLRRFAAELSKKYQCLYLTRNTDNLYSPAKKTITLEDMTR